MKLIHKYTDKQFSLLARYLDTFLKSRDPETLHQARVNIKKIKSVLHLLGYSKKKFRVRKSYLPFRKIFRRAGELRDPYVHAQVVENLHEGCIKEPGVTKKTKKLTRIFVDDIPAFKKAIHAAAKGILPFARQVKRAEIKRYLKQKRVAIRNCMNPRPAMKDIHKTRKAMKEVIYLSEAIGKEHKRVIVFYKEMEELIGTLHDRQTLLAALKKERAPTNRLTVRKIRKESSALSAKIIHLAHQYYQPLSAEF